MCRLTYKEEIRLVKTYCPQLWPIIKRSLDREIEIQKKTFCGKYCDIPNCDKCWITDACKERIPSKMVIFMIKEILRENE